MKYILLFVAILCLASCEKAGTLQKVDNGGHPKLEVYRYYYADGSFVYVSRFKDNTNVVTTTWDESDGDDTVKRANIVIYENDSIKVSRDNDSIKVLLKQAK